MDFDFTKTLFGFASSFVSVVASAKDSSEKKSFFTGHRAVAGKKSFTTL